MRTCNIVPEAGMNGEQLNERLEIVVSCAKEDVVRHVVGAEQSTR